MWPGQKRAQDSRAGLHPQKDREGLVAVRLAVLHVRRCRNLPRAACAGDLARGTRSRADRPTDRVAFPLRGRRRPAAPAPGLAALRQLVAWAAEVATMRSWLPSVFRAAPEVVSATLAALPGLSKCHASPASRHPMQCVARSPPRAASPPWPRESPRCPAPACCLRPRCCPRCCPRCFPPRCLRDSFPLPWLGLGQSTGEPKRRPRPQGGGPAPPGRFVQTAAIRAPACPTKRMQPGCGVHMPLLRTPATGAAQVWTVVRGCVAEWPGSARKPGDRQRKV